jgi:hypothetical protein
LFPGKLANAVLVGAQAGLVVLLEDDAAIGELGDDTLDVVDLPRRRRWTSPSRRAAS